jgi:hypothetical protein
VVTRIVWTARGINTNIEAFDGYMRELGADLPKGLPHAAWKRESGTLVEISSEQFPGSSPVWVWEE